MRDYTIRKASFTDADIIMNLIEMSRVTMQQNGNPTQWPEGYPSKTIVADDLHRGDCYLVCGSDGSVVGSFVLRKGPDLNYCHIYDGAWVDDSLPYHVIHRVTSSPTAHGVFAAMIDFCIRHTVSLRIDTHRNNLIMQHLVKKYGFKNCGIIKIENIDDNERLVYQRLSGTAKV